jgi:Fe2+ or Zn2+ uptake regulation protein
MYIIDYHYIYNNKTAMDILQFIQKFPDENACRIKFKEQRDKTGIICKKCKRIEHFWPENKLCYECIYS